MVFVGMDHGTTGVSFTILSSDDKEQVEHFKIGREVLSTGEVSALEELSSRVPLDKIKLMALTYAMGDGINTIQPLEMVEKRGIISMGGAGKVTGGGTLVYGELENSGVPILLIPGLHKSTPCMDPRFKAAYSHHASAEKVSIAYNAYLESGWENMIVADISSNTVTLLVEKCKIRGAMDACLGAMGLIHGPLDLEMLRSIDDGHRTANDCFSHAGAVKIAGVDTAVSQVKEEILEKFQAGDDAAILALDTMIMTIAMEIWGLLGIAQKVDGVILTGSIGALQEPVNFYGTLKDYLEDVIPVIRIPSTSGSMGSAQIARDIYNGQKEILGIKVEGYYP
ncbi:MAG: methanogenesis marker 12 protein [Euryarchaeota archaeon]|nr:methanogenesis marker 12 protein [Euryarchaeota archaeon]MBU4607027.1 methanogenesis marker 12 protein [Euryarchaeota archaeon]MBV1728717.1 methanogenesis marker 12 protein [Methanobacterium sp.]MBV1754499.1 methanogenesis marker 12 protein [Methanobacterium sp.]